MFQISFCYFEFEGNQWKTLNEQNVYREKCKTNSLFVLQFVLLSMTIIRFCDYFIGFKKRFFKSIHIKIIHKQLN